MATSTVWGDGGQQQPSFLTAEEQHGPGEPCDYNFDNKLFSLRKRFDERPFSSPWGEEKGWLGKHVGTDLYIRKPRCKNRFVIGIRDYSPKKQNIVG